MEANKRKDYNEHLINIAEFTEIMNTQLLNHVQSVSELCKILSHNIFLTFQPSSFYQ